MPVKNAVSTKIRVQAATITISVQFDVDMVKLWKTSLQVLPVLPSFYNETPLQGVALRALEGSQCRFSIYVFQCVYSLWETRID